MKCKPFVGNNEGIKPFKTFCQTPHVDIFRGFLISPFGYLKNI